MKKVLLIAVALVVTALMTMVSVACAMETNWQLVTAKGQELSWQPPTQAQLSPEKNHSARISRPGGFSHFTLAERTKGLYKVITPSYPVTGKMFFRSLGGHVDGWTGTNEPLVVEKTPIRSEVWHRSSGGYDHYKIRRFWRVVSALRCGNSYPTVAVTEEATQIAARLVEEDSVCCPQQPTIVVQQQQQPVLAAVVVPWQGVVQSTPSGYKTHSVTAWVYPETRCKTSTTKQECTGDKPNIPNPPVIPPGPDGGVTTPPNNPEHGFGPGGTGIGKGEPGASIDGPPTLPPGTGQVNAN